MVDKSGDGAGALFCRVAIGYFVGACVLGIPLLALARLWGPAYGVTALSGFGLRSLPVAVVVFAIQSVIIAALVVVGLWLFDAVVAGLRRARR